MRPATAEKDFEEGVSQDEPEIRLAWCLLSSYMTVALLVLTASTASCTRPGASSLHNEFVPQHLRSSPDEVGWGGAQALTIVNDHRETVATVIHNCLPSQSWDGAFENRMVTYPGQEYTPTSLAAPPIYFQSSWPQAQLIVGSAAFEPFITAEHGKQPDLGIFAPQDGADREPTSRESKLPDHLINFQPSAAGDYIEPVPVSFLPGQPKPARKYYYNQRPTIVHKENHRQAEQRRCVRMC